MTNEVQNHSPPSSQRDENRPWPALTIDYELYERMLDESDVSDEEKRAFIEVWWNLIVNFVDLGFGVHPLQQACEQELDLSTLNLPDVLDSKGLQINSEFNKTTRNHEGDV